MNSNNDLIHLFCSLETIKVDNNSSLNILEYSNKFSSKYFRNRKKEKSSIPRWLRHPPAEDPLTQLPSKLLETHFLESVSSSSSESGFKLTISRREKCDPKSRKDIQNSPSWSNVNPTSSLSSSGINCHSGDLHISIFPQSIDHFISNQI